MVRLDFVLGFVFFIFFTGCKKSEQKVTPFQLTSPTKTGITFSNTLAYDNIINPYTFRNFYNGAGVALGDINNDGLLDIYFSGNQVSNKLYLNKGNFTFEDITVKAGVACPDTWSTGVSFADVNGDGFLDLFVCKSGPPMKGVRHNELFMNNGDLTFSEQSVEWGVSDQGLSVHSVFFDYDKDGDLDFYLLNNSNRSVGIFDLREGQREIRDPFGGNKLYRNDGTKFSDVSKEAGIYGSAIGYGLGVSVADVNKDGWPDIFVSNDFFERDYLYINLQNGKFEESLEKYIREISLGSMGADIADLNNDTYPEIFVTDMLPATLSRIKTKIAFENFDKYIENVSHGYHHQFNRNILQLNNGPLPDDTTQVSFSEIGRFAGVHATDWSWGALIFDYDNDGYKDIFVANGIGRDLLDQDYVNFFAPSILERKDFVYDSAILIKLINSMPSEPVQNFLFKNLSENRFNNVATEVGLSELTFSNGAAYGDLDNDGALDLVVNNINKPASVYKNHLVSDRNGFLQLQFQDTTRNIYATGAQITVYCDDKRFYTEQSPGRGYLSSVDPKIHIGLGEVTNIDSVMIRWPDLTCTCLKGVEKNTLIVLNKAVLKSVPCLAEQAIKKYFERTEVGLSEYISKGSSFIDFNRDRLLFEGFSNRGSKLAIADVNNDSLDDIYIGGRAGFPGTLWLQSREKGFTLSTTNTILFEADKASEDTDAVFFDFNSDGYPDLFVTSGGNNFSEGSYQLKDRVYLNSGSGVFRKVENFIMPQGMPESHSFVKTLDFNRDGKTDLLVGSSFIPFQYGKPVGLRLLLNSGEGYLIDVTQDYAPAFSTIGLLTDAALADVDQDGDLDVVVCGHWMGIEIFVYDQGHFRRMSNHGMTEYSGLWNTIETGDFNGDGYPDFVLGNAGLNNHFSDRILGSMIVGDLDGNGVEEQLLCEVVGSKDYPLAMYGDITKQIPTLRKRFPTYDSYKDKSLSDLFSNDVIRKVKRFEANYMSSCVFINRKGMNFEMIPLPFEAQYSKIYSILVMDFNQDKYLDLIVGGNEYLAKPEWGIQDASQSLLLMGNGSANFEVVPTAFSGLQVSGEVRDIKGINLSGRDHVLFLVNSSSLKVFKSNK
ncbi:MAG: VCBS repeat-containing protein [Cyclobacteriaceae bacterium]|nr:VCBS repeat-containing protein [Cyclobacteriaceae bacterium]